MQLDPSDFERLVLACLPDAVLVMDDSAVLEWGNEAAQELFGVSLEDGIGMSALELVHPDDLATAALSMASVQTKEVGTPLELRVRAHDGWRLVEVIGRPFGTNSLLMSLRDLTERRKWEIAGDQVELARAVVQYASSLTVLLGGDGIIRMSSGGFSRLLNVDVESVLGHPFVDIAGEDDRGAITAALAAAVPGVPGVVEAHLRHGNGELVPFALTIADLRDDPTVEGYVVSGHDISDRVRVEDELRSTLSLLQATLDATADGIVVVDRAGGVTAVNGRFNEMWNLTTDVSAGGGDPADPGELADVVPMLVDPDGFVGRIKELYNNPEASSHDELHLVDGRVLERDSQPQRVGGEIVGRVWSFRDVTSTVRLQEELTHQAFHDPLTGLANQALFRDRLAHAAAMADRSSTRLAVCFVDIDEFKTINDSLGHAVGDELLMEVSGRLLECVRQVDTVARLGGDEFAVLVEGVADRDDIEQIAERIIESIHRPIAIAGRDVVVTASVGIAYSGDAGSSDDLLRNADLAMYTAKAEGKNRHCSFAAPMYRAAVERLETESCLRGAAERGELVVHYQPVVDLVDHSTHGFEALVRWQHPTRGLLVPAAFIPLAEQTGLIDEIGLHVLEVACVEAAGWLAVRDGVAAPSVNVNFSARQLLDDNLPDRVAATLVRSGLAAQRLVVEITESALMSDPLAAIDCLRRLADLGCGVAVDDFGTGYSSLAYLQQFPIDILKVDRSFVADCGTARGSMVAAIVQLAATLGLTPVAEGVETAAQAQSLEAVGCRLAQGYLLGRPADAEATRARLDAERASFAQDTSTSGRSNPSASARA